MNRSTSTTKAHSDELSLKVDPPRSDVEVSGINDRIFDDAWEKTNFEARKHEMNLLVATSKTQIERATECKGKCGGETQ